MMLANFLRTRFFTPFSKLFLLIAGLGLAFVFATKPTQARREGEGDFLATFSSVLTTIKNHSYRELDPTELIDGAIHGMLATLDPHTHYLPPQNYENMRAEQAGSFYGIGISFVIRGGLITVISPIEGTPAFRAGIRAGDQIVKIEGKSAEGIPQMEVVRKLRGAKNTKVKISVKRQGLPELLEFELTRDVIPLNSLSTSYLREDKIGYVKINHFSKTTPRELDKSLEELESQGMQALILDLRSNPGGLLEAAWRVVDRFLPEGRVIVSTDGRLDDSDFTFRARQTFPGRDYPIVVLVDQGSASASEIVSGALQDWDRALIVGQRTFGKGLVQRLIPLGNNGESGALQLTTAEYFTPAKRNIQKPFTAYKEHLYQILGAQSPMSNGQDKEFLTKGGRKVKGGGGITPDEIVEYEETTRTFARLIRRNTCFNFVIAWVNSHPDIRRPPTVDDAFLKNFADYVLEQKIEIVQEEWDKDLEHLRYQLMAELANALMGPAERRRIINDDDVMVKAAIEFMPEAKKLMALRTAQKPR